MSSAQEILKIERSVVLRAPRSRVWRALTRAEEFASWFNVTMRGDFTPGGRVTMETKYPGYEGLSFPLFVQRMEPEHLFSWRWYPGAAVAADDDPGKQTEVVFTLEEVAEGTRLTVVESGFERVDLARRAKAFADNTEGWTAQLHNIEVFVRGAP
jgi:uncharacterized protein YndB with AHSA1/START domain